MPRYQAGFQKVVVLVLAVIAVAVFLLLPQFVSEPWLAPETDVTEVSNSSAGADLTPSSRAQKTKFRQDAQFILAKILVLRDRLTEQQVSQWASFEFGQALQEIEQGDEQYRLAEYQQALQRYQSALGQLEALTASAEQKLAQAKTDAAAALQAGQLAAATAAVELAVAIGPEQPEVQQLQARLAVLPELLALLQQGGTLQQQGELQAASQAIAQAAKLDPLHQQASEALAAIAVAITDRQFNQAMSSGYRALDADQFERAATAFQQAAKVYPDNPAVEQARGQLQSRQSQLWTSQQFAKAKQFEQREQWSQAVAVYQQMLATEPTLTEVAARKIPAKVRASLDEQLQKTLQEPLKLSYRSNFNNAVVLLADVRGISQPGERLRGQIASLDELINRSQTPVDVVFQSDALTDVTLYRVSKLGFFEQKTLTLKAGSYTVAGSRKGFRDVRVNFTVNGEPLERPIVVRCTEPI
jgi:tetratricopeptide (TPR) repeat protein